jgi:hypothetical protein
MKDGKRKGEISLEVLKSDNISRNPPKKKKFSFEISAPEKSWLLAAEDEGEMNFWIEAILRSIAKNTGRYDSKKKI